MIKSGFRPALELWDNALGQYFSELDAPLIEGVDVPDGTLREDRVLVESDELAECFRCELFGKDRV